MRIQKILLLLIFLVINVMIVEIYLTHFTHEPLKIERLKQSDRIFLPRLITYPLDELTKRNTNSHQWVVYAQRKDPIGTARRLTNHLSSEIRIAAQGKFDPLWMEAIIYIESGGQNLEPKTSSAAAGIAQFMPATARSYGLKVDLARRAYLKSKLTLYQGKLRRYQQLSPTYQKKISRLVGRKRFARYITINRRQWITNKINICRQVIYRINSELPSTDQRLVPQLALRAMADYLFQAKAMFGRSDLAIQSYHSGVGNIGRIINAYISPHRPKAKVRQTVADFHLSWPRIYFDARPKTKNPHTHQLIFGMKDYSYTYFWNVQAARTALSFYRRSPRIFRRLVSRYSLIRRKNSLKDEVLAYPHLDKLSFNSFKDLARANQNGKLILVKNYPRYLGIKLDPRIGQRWSNPHQRKYLRQTKPETYGLIIYLANLARQESNSIRPITVSSLVRSKDYHRLLGSVANSIHCTGRSFDVCFDPRLTWPLIHLREMGHLVYLYEKNNGLYHITLTPQAVGIYTNVFKDAMDFLESKQCRPLPRQFSGVFN